MRRTVLSTVLLFACGSPPQPRDAGSAAPDAAVVSNPCDGGTSLTLGLLTLPNIARVFPGQQVMWDNGARFLFLTGTCDYWAARGDLWVPPRTGHLSEDQAIALAGSLKLDAWPTWAGAWTPDNSVFDAPTLALLPGLDLRQTVFCSRLCRGAPVPNDLQQLAQTYPDDLERLWTSGVPVESDIRYMLVRATTNQPPALGAFDWPLTEATFTAAALTAAQAADAPYGSGHLAQGADAVTLRDLRQRYRTSDIGRQLPFIPVWASDGGWYQLYLRDTLPIEDPTGLIRSK
jgi:hypothetical protein